MSRPGPWVAIAGARPNFVKLAPLVRAAAAAGRELLWVHTGQHKSGSMSEAILTDLDVPPPIERLSPVRPGPDRIAAMMRRIAHSLKRLAPSLVAVLGDVDSTAAGALAADQLGLPLAHVEAGLRSFDLTMPEERNRIVADSLADRLHIPEPGARHNLVAEGVANVRIHAAGNVMADALGQARAAIEALEPDAVSRFGARGYVLATLHRAANVDDPRRLAGLLSALARVARDIPIVLPLHPRTRRRMRDAGLRLDRAIRPTRALSYLRFLATARGAAVIVTDSGGLQVEAALLGVRCVTLRDRTEHQITLDHGNVLAGNQTRRVPKLVREALAGGPVTAARPRAWDGRAAGRIVGSWAKGPGHGARVAPESLLPASLRRRREDDSN